MEETVSQKVVLDAPLVHGISDLFLKSRFDRPQPTPAFHDEMWSLCCSSHKYVAIAAPRGHAKSTAITHSYLLSALLFRTRKFALLVSDTESQAAQFLGDLKIELAENEDLIQQFEIKRFIKESETDIIVEFKDGEQFRIIAKGSEQKIRGLKWRGMRPDIIAIDDAENDEIVMNPERREKFRNWFLNALLPCGGDDCLVRMVGTILHLDSMLNRLLHNKSWKTLKFSAHDNNYENILWPEKFSKERLMAIRANYEAEGNLEGYEQEYRNNPIAEGNAYFRKQDFIAMDAPDYESHKLYVSSVDMAISEKEKADFTVFMVAGVDAAGVIHIVDVRKGRIGSKEIIDEMISIGRRYEPDPFIVETEKIDKAIGPFLEDEMRRTSVFLNIVKKTPSKSKTTRGRSIQAMMRSGSIRFDKEADWYPDLEAELMTMTNAGAKGGRDDQFDAFAYIGMAVNMFRETPDNEELDDEEWESEYGDDYTGQGACIATGY